MELIMTTTRKNTTRKNTTRKAAKNVTVEAVTFYPPVVVGTVTNDSCYYPPVEYQTVSSHDDTVDADYYESGVSCVNSNANDDTHAHDTHDTYAGGMYNYALLLKNGKPTVTSVCAIVPDIAQRIIDNTNVQYVSWTALAHVIVDNMKLCNIWHKTDMTNTCFIETVETVTLANGTTRTSYIPYSHDVIISNPAMYKACLDSTRNRIRKNWHDLIYLHGKTVSFKIYDTIVPRTPTESFGFYTLGYRSNTAKASQILKQFVTKETLKNTFKSAKSAKAAPKAEPKKQDTKAAPKAKQPKADTSETDTLRAERDALKAELAAMKAKQEQAQAQAQSKTKTVLRKKA